MGLAQAASTIKDPSSLKSRFGLVDYTIGDIVIDVLVDETPIFDFEVTEHPVEAGLDITDSRIARPVGLSLECIFTDAAFDAKSIVKGLVNSNLSLFTWQDKKAALYKMKDRNEVLTINTPLDTYDNMMIVSIIPNQRAETGKAFFFRIELKEIRIVSTIISSVDSSQIPQKLQKQKPSKAKAADRKKGPPVKKGVKAGETTNSSILSNLLG